MNEAARKPRRLTSKDVAQRAGVSQSIVSFYFTGKRPVSKKARARIEQAIDHMGSNEAAATGNQNWSLTITHCW